MCVEGAGFANWLPLQVRPGIRAANWRKILRSWRSPTLSGRAASTNSAEMKRSGDADLEATYSLINTG
jgi:hypothetical protein